MLCISVETLDRENLGFGWLFGWLLQFLFGLYIYDGDFVWFKMLHFNMIETQIVKDKTLAGGFILNVRVW